MRRGYLGMGEVRGGHLGLREMRREYLGLKYEVIRGNLEMKKFINKVNL